MKEILKTNKYPTHPILDDGCQRAVHAKNYMEL